MPEMNLDRVDLNLLRVLEALLTDPNTTRVAERLGMSQPAVSKCLGRLRFVLDDPLLVRQGNRLVPTAYAQSLAGPLRAGLEALHQPLERRTLDPGRISRTFRILGDDYLVEILVPVLASLLNQAPDVRVRLLPVDPRPIASQLADERIDLVFARVDQPPPTWIECTVALHGTPLVVARRRHDRLARAKVRDGERIPIDLYCDMPQVAFAPDDARFGHEDNALRVIGRRRAVALTVHDFFALARVVSRTDLIGSLPAPFALAVADAFDLSVHPLPFPFDPVPLGLFWHRRRSNEPEHRWMRNTFLEHLKRFGDAGAGAVPTNARRR